MLIGSNRIVRLLAGRPSDRMLFAFTIHPDHAIDLPIVPLCSKFASHHGYSRPSQSSPHEMIDQPRRAPKRKRGVGWSAEAVGPRPRRAALPRSHSQQICSL